MTKNELIRRVAEQSGMNRQDAGRAVEAILHTIQETLKSGGEVTFTGFGKFHVSERSARHGVNPQTGQRIQIAARKVPRFSAGSELRRSLGSLPGKGEEKF